MKNIALKSLNGDLEEKVEGTKRVINDPVVNNSIYSNSDLDL
jgi:hypothetical protein